MAEHSPNRLKTLWEKEKLLVMSNFSFSHSVFKRLVLQTRKNQGLFGKGLSTAVQNIDHDQARSENAVHHEFTREILRPISAGHSCYNNNSVYVCGSVCVCLSVCLSVRIYWHHNYYNCGWISK